VFDTVTKAALDVATPAPPPPPPGTMVLAAFPLAPTCSFADTFGAPRSGGRQHQGVDIMAKSGTPIYAVMDGTITKKQVHYVGSLGGNSLWLSAADGSYFFYAHLSAFAGGIEVGSVVTAGTLIGYVGATGNASVPHLHFEVHPGGGAAVNPYPIVKAATTCK
jgi:murein DD-endopeptidase MepM/ murein hydrolase activator NlpD